jgi:hypothetical protein
MGAKRPLLLALAISLLGHFAVVLLYPDFTFERPVARFDVELVAPDEQLAVAGEEPAPALKETDQATEHVESGAKTLVPEAEVPGAVESAELVEEPGPPRTILNLSRPPDWEEIRKGIPAPGPGLAFNPALDEALRRRQSERRRLALVSGRQAAVYGVADEDYGRTGSLGEELKMNGGCVTLVEDNGVEEGQRWWTGQCAETRQNRFTLPEIEYDALGRAAVD